MEFCNVSYVIVKLVLLEQKHSVGVPTEDLYKILKSTHVDLNNVAAMIVVYFHNLLQTTYQTKPNLFDVTSKFWSPA